MIKNILVLILGLGLIGCASAESQKYLTIYNNALNLTEMTSVTKHESYQQLKEPLAEYINLHGYTMPIFADPKEGLIVFAKEGNPHPSQIILKITRNIGVNKVRVDLVRGSRDPATDDQVSQDIQEIAALIKNG